MYSTAQKYLYKLKKINRQKILWYKLSVFVLMAISISIIEYDFIVEEHLEKYLTFIGLTISAVWWYWTMGVLSTLIGIKKLQIELIEDIVINIKEVKITIDQLTS